MKFPSVTWTEPGYPSSIDISPDTLERLRRRVIQGLVAIPKTGLGLGGLLLGTRDPESGAIRVEDVLEFPCDHFGGPSFNLTAEERTRAVALTREPALRTVVGWYFSKTQPPAAPRASELDLYEVLCPAPWQIMLLLRPSQSEVTKVSVYFRDIAGEVIQGPARDVTEWLEGRDLDLPEIFPYVETVVPPPVARPPSPTAGLPVGELGFESVRSFKLMHGGKAQAVTTPPPVESVLPAKAASSDAVSARPIPQAPRSTQAQASDPGGQARSRKKWLLISAVTAAALSVVAAATSSLWLSPSLRLELSESGGHITAIWNADSVSRGQAGSLVVTDSGQVATIPLSPAKVVAGVAGFDAKTGKISAVLKIGDKQAEAKWEAPESWAPPPVNPGQDAPKPKP